MHVHHVTFRILLFFTSLIALTGAFTGALADSGNSSLQVKPTSVSMRVGETATIAVTSSSGSISATSGDSSLLTVSYSRNVVTLKALKAGSTSVKIRLRSDGHTTSRSVPVTISSANTASLTVSPTSLSLTAGNTASIAVSNASGTVTAMSSAPSIATVTYANGVASVAGLKAGSATITVTDSRTSKTVAVTVAAASVSLSVSPSFVAVSVGNTGTATVSNASGTVTATSSDLSVATVSISGNTVSIKGIKVGTAAITVKDSKTSALVQVSVASGPVPTLGGYALLAWNDLGMHCVDGKDYSVFSILPPYNNLHAQLVNKVTGKQVTSGVTLTYEAMADDTVPSTDPLFGSINTTSVTKTNFWGYVKALFGASPAPDVGLNLSKDPGNRTPSLAPQPMSFASATGWYQAEGIPIVPTDDQGKKNFYPMVKVVAKDASGNVLATAKTVLPVSDEMTCKACHASNTSADARPTNGWLNDIDPEKDWKKNILRLHDDQKLGTPAYKLALAAVGYSSTGLHATVQAGQPVLCAACHSSNALLTTGQPNVRALTHALHTKHATVKDPSGNILGAVTNRTSCYMCHPGSETQCLRGAMSSQSQSCQNCHGNMADVGNTARTGWLEQPNCQACHHDGQREIVGVTANGKPKVWADTRFATNPNTPATGFSLYRFSKGHGGLQCEACHGATHAEYPSTHAQDNALSIGLQGHAGTVAECTACHQTMPTTVSGGPHGMHTTGDAWVKSHENASKTGCTACHGADYRGSPLSEIKVAKTINKKNFAAGHQMSCYDCHNGPNP